jgi:hypothetical protein
MHDSVKENMITITLASFVSSAFLIAAIMMIILVITPAYAIEAFRTYKDPVSLFTIQYPSDWKTVGEKAGHVTFMPHPPSNYGSNAGHVSSLTIAVINENVSTLDQLVSKEKFELAHTPLVTARIVNESQITLSGLPAHKIVTESVLSSTTVQFNTVEIFTLKDGKQYSISYNLGQIDDLPIIQQMITSFKIQK